MLNYILLICFIISLLFNLSILFNMFNSPVYKLGTLTKDTLISSRLDGKHILTLPRGMIVKNETPEGFARAGLFDPYIFSIYVSSSDEKLVDYSHRVKDDAIYTTNP